MAQVRVVWLQRVMGRFPGLEEVAERTPFVETLAAQRRLKIIEEIVPLVFVEDVVAPEPIVGVFIDQPLSGEDLSPVGHGEGVLQAIGSVLDYFEPEDAPVVERPKPAPRPRTRTNKLMDPSE